MHFSSNCTQGKSGEKQLDRRGFLKSAGAATGLCALTAGCQTVPLVDAPSRDASVAAVSSLREAAKMRGIEVGAMASLEQLTNPALSGVYARNFTLAGMLFGEMEWGSNPGFSSDPSFWKMRQYLDRCDRLGLRARARQVYSYENQPRNAGLRPDGSPKSKSELERTLVKRVEQCCRPLRGRNAIIQVVDEVMQDNGPGLRRNPFADALGEEYVDILFHAAHEAAPDALLTYQEYGPETDAYGFYRDKTRGYLGLLERLRKRNVPITGAAFGGFAFPEEGWPYWNKRFFRTVENLGYDIHVNELTVLYSFCGSPKKWTPATAEENDRKVNEVYSRAFEFLLQFERLREVTFFAPIDGNNTVESGTLCLRPYPRAMPGILNRDLSRKPVYENIANIIANSRPRR